MKFTCGSVMDDEDDELVVRLMRASLGGVLGGAPLVAAHVPLATRANGSGGGKDKDSHNPCKTSGYH